jgi:hypothetical protein
MPNNDCREEEAKKFKSTLLLTAARILASTVYAMFVKVSVNSSSSI